MWHFENWLGRRRRRTAHSVKGQLNRAWHSGRRRNGNTFVAWGISIHDYGVFPHTCIHARYYRYTRPLYDGVCARLLCPARSILSPPPRTYICTSGASFCYRLQQYIRVRGKRITFIHILKLYTLQRRRRVCAGEGVADDWAYYTAGSGWSERVREWRTRGKHIVCVRVVSF